MHTILHEVRLGLRQMRKAPAFTLVAVLTLALGIGANTAVFTLLDQALLRSLPVSHPEQLVRLHWTGDSPGHFNSYGGEDNDYFSYPMYRDLRDKNAVLQDVIANDQQNVAISWNNKPDMAGCELVSGNYFEALGVRPALGRLILPSDEALNANLVVVLSFNYWKTHFGSQPSVVNQTLLINTQPFTIIGVAPPGFHSIVAGAVEDLFVPVTAKAVITPRWQDLEDRRSQWLTLSGRLRPGFSRQQAEAAMAPLWHALRAEEFKTFNHKDRWQKRFLDDSRLQLLDGARGFSPLRDQISVPLLVLMGMVALLVLMACVNVSSLLLVRAAGRAREFSVRYALGAGRWQIIRQLLIEGVLLGLAGGALGLALAPAVSQVLIRRLLSSTTTDLPFNPNPDLRILFFSFALAFFVSLAFSLAPALHFLNPDLVGALKQQTLTSAGAKLRFRRVLVGVQIGLSLLLLIAAGLFVRTLRNLQSVDLGFNAEHLVGFNVNPRLAGYQPDQVNALNRRILETLSALPGVRSVAATDDPDLSGNDDSGGIRIVGYNAREDEDMQAEQPWITPQYFTTMQVPLLAGRLFTDDDIVGRENVGIVNASFAQHYFGSPQAALGRIVNFGSIEKPVNASIVGVVGDTKHSGVRDPVRRTIYRPLFQSTEPNFVTFVIRTWQPPATAENTIRAAMQQLDSKLALGRLRTMDDMIADNLSSERLIALLSASFGLLAMVMAAIGLYGVLAYSTAQRTREIGIRMALGAQRLGVVRLVITDVLWLAGISIAVTVPLSLLFARAIRTQLFGVSPFDPLTLLAGTLLVALVVLLSALLPAKRAASVEPMKALRTE
ncbi:MAG TPA: ABC transporter permease [Candidatus Eisenbacteria bacterium]|nr:ABC transporter permease [Candidatus Eisenbacteria bacterium]